MKVKLKDILFVGIMAFLVITGTYAATYLYSADEVGYDNNNSSLTSSNIQDALDELYTKCNNSTTTCPSGHTCTNKTNIKCKRATTLHTEICNRDSNNYWYCLGGGYKIGDTITYGNEEVIDGVLTVGDAFDCDVNGDGTYDPATERFYYVSDYYDTSAKTFYDAIAVLIYYSNTTGGVASTSSVLYDNSGVNNNGPIVAINDLPTTTQWSNVSLYKDTRQILTEKGGLSTSAGTLPANFSYSGYAARLLTYQELYHGCHDFVTEISGDSRCYFLFERSGFISTGVGTDGPLLENPQSTTVVFSMVARSRFRDVGPTGQAGADFGTRPVIEILKSEILY